MTVTLERPQKQQPRPRQRWNVEPPRNKRGELKKRLSLEEDLYLLDPWSSEEATEEHLQVFKNLFAFRYGDGSITRVNQGPSAWTVLRGGITLDRIARHLLADRIPTRPPLWIGARSCRYTMFAAIDVDNHRPYDAKKAKTSRSRDVHGDKPILSFRERCRKVEEAFRNLGIDPDNRNQVLVQPTPSGGRHYYVFLTRPCRVDDLTGLWEMVGLEEQDGQIEFYPKTNRALRLPFGLTPGRKHNLQAWIDFIDAYAEGRIRRFSYWKQLLPRALALQLERAHEAEAAADQQLPYQGVTINQAKGMAAKPAVKPAVMMGKPSLATNRAASRHQSQVASYLGLPKRHRVTPLATLPLETTALNADPVERFQQLVQDGPQSFAEAEELFALGILLPGTRHAVLNHLATHLVFFRGLSAEEAAERLTAWALDPRHQSNDIQADLQNGTGRVAKNIGHLCRWYADRRRTSNPASTTPGKGNAKDKDIGKDKGKSIHAPGRLFSLEELKALRPSVLALPVEEREHQAHFYLSFLAFAKLHGVSAKDGSGWEAAPAIKPVVRRWTGCHHMNYKTRVQAAEAAGLLQMTREKFQAPPGQKGRARTYRLRVPVVARQQWSLRYEEALALLTHDIDLANGMVKTPVETTVKTANGAVQVDQPLQREAHDERGQDHPRPCRAGKPCPRGAADHAAHLHPPRAGSHLDPRPRERPPEPNAAVGLPDQLNAILAAIDAPDEAEAPEALAEEVVTPVNTATPPATKTQPTISEWTMSYILPPATDHAAVDDRITRLKSYLAVKYSGRRFEDHPTWEEVASMAKDPTYSNNHRYLLLNDPSQLSPAAFQDRQALIREYRSHPAHKVKMVNKAETMSKAEVQTAIANTSALPSIAALPATVPDLVIALPPSATSMINKEPHPKVQTTDETRSPAKLMAPAQVTAPIENECERRISEVQASIADLLADRDLPRVVRRVLTADPEKLPEGDKKLRLSVLFNERRRQERGLPPADYGEEAAWYVQHRAGGRHDPYSDPACRRQARESFARR